MSIAVAIIVLGVLIFVHELGHFTVAKMTGVYVEKFSLGFGPRLFGFKYGETEYALSLFPLGGYVKMYGQEGVIEGADTEDISKKGRSFTDKTRWQRALIVLAGPLTNILFAVIIFWGLFMSGIPSFSATIGDVEQGSPAELAGIKSSDKVIAVDNIEVKSWNDFANYIALNPEKVVNIRLADGDKVIPVMVTRAKGQNMYGESVEVGSIGVNLFIPPVIGAVVTSMPASDAGLTKGDKILSINSIPVTSWVDSTKIIRSKPGEELKLIIDRNGEQLPISLTPKLSDNGIGLAGINAIQGDILVNYGIFESLKLGFQKSYEFTVSILTGLGKLINRTVSTDQLGGPIMIVQMAADSAQSGLITLLSFMAIISVNLAVFNLLPIPVLDGGHLLILAIEGVTRRKINERILGGFQTLGFVLLMSLMVFAFYNDIARMIMK